MPSNVSKCLLVTKSAKKCQRTAIRESGSNNRIVAVFIDGLYTKGTRAHAHRELLREWLWESNGSSLEYLGAWGGSRRRDPMAALRCAYRIVLVARVNPGVNPGGGGRRRRYRGGEDQQSVAQLSGRQQQFDGAKGRLDIYPWTSLGVTVGLSMSICMCIYICMDI